MKDKLKNPIVNLIMLCLIAIIIILSVMIIVPTKDESEDTVAISLEASMGQEDSVITQDSEDEILPLEETILMNEYTEFNLNSGVELDPFEFIKADIENLKSGDSETVARYFGNSDVFTPEIIADRVAATDVNFIDYTVLDDGTLSVNVHICTLDYTAMNDDFNIIVEEAKSNSDAEADSEIGLEEEYLVLAKRTIAENLINSKYNTCYNIPVVINLDDQVVVSESLKYALTGGWYTGVGVQMTPVECIATEQ